MSALFDTNILVYGFDDTAKAQIARRTLAQGGRIAVQSLNELALVLRRLYGLAVAAMRTEVDRVVETFIDAVPLTIDIHRVGLNLVARYQFVIYDSMLLAAALSTDCIIFHSEDLADGQIIDGRLTTSNPFA